MSKTNTDVRAAVFWETISRIAGKRTERDLLADGSEHRVRLTLRGQVGKGSAFEESFDGRLRIGHPQQRTKTTQPDLAQLLVLFAEKLTERQRKLLFTKIKRAFTETRELPEANEEILKSCQSLIKNISVSETVSARGAIVFHAKE